MCFFFQDLESDLDGRLEEDQKYVIAKRKTTTTVSTNSDEVTRPIMDLADNTGDKRRHSTRRNNSSNYKSNEASHYGTLSRSKKVSTKTKTKQSDDKDE